MTVYFLKKKSDAASKYGSFWKIVPLRCDNGSELTGDIFRDLMIKNKIKQEFSAPYSQFQNGTSERSWKTIFDMTRCLLLQSGLPKELRNYAARFATYVRNRCYNNRLDMTPFEAFTSKNLICPKCKHSVAPVMLRAIEKEVR